jgi:hypothetical protein
MMLGAASLVLTVSVVYGAWQFFAPPQASVTDAVSGGIAGFNRAQLSSVVEFYSKKQVLFEIMMSGE